MENAACAMLAAAHLNSAAEMITEAPKSSSPAGLTMTLPGLGG